MLNSNLASEMKTEFSKFLEKYYLNWQMENGRASIREFSRWLDINHAMIDQWMNGKGRPGAKSIPKLARKLGPEVYEILNISPPPLFIQKLEAIYDELTPEQRQDLIRKINKILSDYP